MDPKMLTKLNDFLKPLQLTLGPTSVIARRRSFWATSGDSSEMLSSGTLVFCSKITLDQTKLDVAIQLTSLVTTLTLTLNTKTGSALKSVLSWLQGLLPGSQPFDFDGFEKEGFGPSSLGEFHFRRVTVELVKDPVSGKAKLSTFRLDVEVGLIHDDKPPVLFLLSYTYDKNDGSTVHAKLWTAAPIYLEEKTLWPLLPDYERYSVLTPVSIDDTMWSTSLDLAALAGVSDLPDFLPTQLLTAEFWANKKAIDFQASLKPKKSSGGVPVFQIAEISLEASYEWAKNGALTSSNQAELNVALGIKALLQQPEGATFGWPCQIVGIVAYSSNPPGWTLSGTVEDLYASTLVQFFDTDASIQAAVMPILEAIRLEYFNITYQYSNKIASSFQITGILVIGFHRFTLNFQHSGQSWWSFTASAEPAQNHNVKSTVGNLVHSVAGTDMELPEFVSNIEVQVSKDDRMHLVIRKSNTTTGAASMLILLTVKLGKFTVRYIQFREIFPTHLAAVTPTQRVLIASMNDLPGSEIPLVGKVGQPYDKVLFMWVKKTSSQATGLTKAQLDTVNQTLKELNQSPLLYKVVKKGDPAPTDVLLLHGLHFMLMRKATSGPDTVALDYAFNRPKKTKALADNGVEDKGSPMAPYERGERPLSIKNIGFKYSTGHSGKESILGIRLDAYAKIGPVEFALLGLMLGLNFAGTKNGKALSLHNLPDPVVDIEGLEAGFNRPPLEIAGMLQYKNTADEVSFAGALVISFVPWRFQAAGYYGLVNKQSSQEKMNTFFLYCVLQGPLITFEFASIEGVCGGFGYNSNLTFPTPQNVTQFPLIASSSDSPSPDGRPNEIMEHLLSTIWFFPRDGSFCVAAGLTVKAFEILSVQAVLVVQWNPEVEIGIFGLAAASIPGGKSTKQFAHVELGITATLSFRTGVMKIEGELTPASFILDPSCHLTGGFALYTWFDDKGGGSVKGDWVFTIGGFHPRYVKPPQYPNPPRLGISWQFGKAISISGQAYFAITPKVCMGGSRLDVALSLNPLFAYFNAFIDFLINYKPFSFIAEGGLTVGVRFTLDLWLVCINIKVEIGARLYIEGPPIRGVVHVDFWVFGFDINFGSDSKGKPDPLKLDEFVDVVCQTHTSGMPTLNLPAQIEADSEANDPEPHVFAVQEGLIPNDKVKSTPSGKELWKVRASTFEFSVTSKFAVQEAFVITPTKDGPVVKEVPNSKGSVFAKPMHTTSSITSILRITVTPDQPYVMSDDYPTEPLWDKNESIRKDVPLALWGMYDSSSDPTYNKNPDSLLRGTKDKSVNLTMGVHLKRPDPNPSADKTVPFNVEKFQIQHLDADNPIAIPYQPTPAFEPIASTGKKQWEAVKNVYIGKEEAAKTTVDVWKSFGLKQLGWAKKKIETAAGVSTLTGSKPERIVNDLPKYYLWAPMLSWK